MNIHMIEHVGLIIMQDCLRYSKFKYDERCNGIHRLSIQGSTHRCITRVIVSNMYTLRSNHKTLILFTASVSHPVSFTMNPGV